MKVSIIIPVYNEEKTVGVLINRVLYSKIQDGVSLEIIVVDDGSKDKSKEIIFSFKEPFLKILLPENKGKGAAIKEALKNASGDFILIQDADLEYNPSFYKDLFNPILKKEAEIVFGSRELCKNKRNYYRVGNFFLTVFFNFLFKKSLTDFSTCYKIFPREFIPRLLTIKHNDFVFDVFALTAVLSMSGMRILEIPISYYPRSKKSGKKLSIKDGIRVFFEMLKFSYKKII